MKKILLLTLLLLIPTAIAQNIITTTEELPTNHTLELNFESPTENDAYTFNLDDWLNLENLNPTAEGYNLTLNLTITIPITEEGNYTKKAYYNSTYFLDNKTEILIEIINTTKENISQLEQEKKSFEECVSRKYNESSQTDEHLRMLQAESECRYEITNQTINNTIIITENQTITEIINVVDQEMKDKIGTLETTTTGINTEIGNIKTGMENWKTDIINRIQSLEDNLTSQQNTEKEEKKTGINWTLLLIILGISIPLMGGGFYMIRKKQQQDTGGFNTQPITPPITPQEIRKIKELPPQDSFAIDEAKPQRCQALCRKKLDQTAQKCSLCNKWFCQKHIKNHKCEGKQETPRETPPKKGLFQKKKKDEFDRLT